MNARVLPIIENVEVKTKCPDVCDQRIDPEPGKRLSAVFRQTAPNEVQVFDKLARDSISFRIVPIGIGQIQAKQHTCCESSIRLVGPVGNMKLKLLLIVFQ